MIQTSDILRKVRLLEIRSRRLASQLFTGEYHAAFRGQGMRYREIRDYQPGDDIRFIDWNVSARYGHPFTKVFEEERALQVLFLVDISKSMHAGTVQLKKERAIEIAATLAFSAALNQDQVGAVLFDNQIYKILKPAKGSQQVLLLIRQLLQTESSANHTNYEPAFRAAHQLAGRKGVCFLISDFTGDHLDPGIRAIAKHFDLIGVHIYDPVDQILPEAEILRVQDAEQGQTRLIDTGDAFVRYEYEQDFLRHHEKIKALFRSSGAELVSVRTDDDYIKVLQKFFLKRIR